MLNRQYIFACSIILVMFFMAGCSPFPIKKDNILTKPIRIELPATDGTVVKPRDEFVAEALMGLDSYLQDDLGRSKAAGRAGEIYDEKFATIKYDNMDRIKSALSNALLDINGYAKSFTTTRLPNPSVSISSNLLNNSEGSGRVSAILKDNWRTETGSNFPYSVKGEIEIDLIHHMSDGKIIVDISSIGYLFNCVFGSAGGGCIEAAFKLNNDALINNVINTTSVPQKTFTASELRNYIKRFLEDRYSVRNFKTEKIERAYRIDFATAKARLQRSMGSFKYDNEKSAFIFEKSYDSPIAGKSNKVSHRYVLSLFPDRKETVVEFSGEYEFFYDAFGGPDKYGKSSFDTAMMEYISNVDRILKK